MRIANVFLANIFILGIITVYLSVKFSSHPSIRFLLASIIPLILLEIGSYLFLRSPTSITSATLVVLSLGLIPLAFTSFSHTLGRGAVKTGSTLLRVYSLAQMVVFFFFARDLYAGRTVDSVSSIVDQPLILIRKESRYWIFNLLLSCGAALYGFENTLRNATKKQTDGLKGVLAAFTVFIVYFAYLSVQTLLFSYISESMLLVGASIISVGVILISYAFGKHPFWQVEIRVSRRIIFGCLSTAVVAIYLAMSGNIIDFVRFVEPGTGILIASALALGVGAAVSIAYLSPKFSARVENFLTRNFFTNKYDYGALWMRFSEKSSGHSI